MDEDFLLGTPGAAELLILTLQALAREAPQAASRYIDRIDLSIQREDRGGYSAVELVLWTAGRLQSALNEDRFKRRQATW